MLEKYNEARRRKYANDAEYRRMCIEKAKKWNKENPDKVKEYNRNYNRRKSS